MLVAHVPDTARHYMTPAFLNHIVDAMEYSKLSVLHWHITDDESFPIVSTKYPLLSEAGAFCPTCVYTPDAVAAFVECVRVPVATAPAGSRSRSLSGSGSGQG